MKKPSVERCQIVAFLVWWSKDQTAIAERTLDLDKEIEFSIRGKALADAARDVLGFGDERWAAQAIEAQRAETGTGSVEDESAVAESDVPKARQE